MPKDGLTPKQAAFVREYLIDHNGTQAAIRAGYSKNGAEVTASQLLRNPKVAQAIKAGEAKLEKKVEITKEKIVERLNTVAERCMSETPVYDLDGEPTGEFKFDANNAIKANVELSKLLGYATADKFDGTMTVRVVQDEE